MKWTGVFLAALLLSAGGPRVESTADVSADLLAKEGEEWTASRETMEGETVLLRAELPARAGEELVIRGVFSPGLVFDEVVDLTLSGKAVNASHYTVVTAQPRNDAFAIHLADRFAPEDGTLSLSFAVSVREDPGSGQSARLMVAAGEGEPYMTAPVTFSSHSLEICRCLELPDGQTRPVAGACLSLYNGDGTKRIAFREIGPDEYRACAAEDCGHARHLYVMRTPNSGRVKLDGLPAGRYSVRETRPAEGRTETLAPLEIIVTREGTVVSGGADCPDGRVLYREEGESAGEPEKGPDLLSLYRAGSRILAVALTLLLAGRRYYLP